MTDSEDRIGKNVRALRGSKMLSQAELAARMTALGAPMHQQSIYKVEAGERRIRLTEAIAMAHVFGVSVDFLAAGIPEEMERRIRLDEAMAELECARKAVDCAASDHRRAAGRVRALMASLEADGEAS